MDCKRNIDRYCSQYLQPGAQQSAASDLPVPTTPQDMELSESIQAEVGFIFEKLESFESAIANITGTSSSACLGIATREAGGSTAAYG